ncbi:uncharacterized protein LOC107614685 [Arachis ipaensis]|uniref:uncharacterized protein LOC107614685 n=1 Tax=Arachis ipaensis TaxID=130454 RepID=UPI0007AFE0B9|nr:uncharacterized protein LOC107614685 [Arachis ipaensis]XP_025676754.1 uncharacterized protein LOC112776734 [Arachis hypogaea]
MKTSTATTATRDGDASFSLRGSLSLGSGLPRDDTTAATVAVTPTGATSLPSSSLPSPENLLLKEQIQVLIKERNSFKNAFRIQHERFSEYDEKNQELQHLKQLVSQYQEQIRTLGVNNYALAMHLKQAQQSNPFPGHFPPDVF